MLRDLPPNWTSANDPFIAALRRAFSHFGTPDEPVRVYRGVYEAHINFDKEIERLVTGRWPEFPNFPGHDWFSCFGVVDHWSQLPIKQLDADPRSLLVFLGRHVRAEQPERGGWRWHKWGPYLGVHAPENSTEYEYLYDATDVVEVWSYCVVEVR